MVLEVAQLARVEAGEEREVAEARQARRDLHPGSIMSGRGTR
jgi:hypothetical protein